MPVNRSNPENPGLLLSDTTTNAMTRYFTFLGIMVALLGTPLRMPGPSLTNADPIIPSRDSSLLIEKIQLARTGSTVAEKTFKVAQSFLGTPYVLGCLDRTREEKLTVNLRELDCWTFVENSVAIALAGEQGFAAYLEELRQLRYWGGTIDGYGSRIHYFTGWILQAQKNGILQDVTTTIGGVPYDKKFGYISARKAKYPKISDPTVLQDIRNAEKRINSHKWFYIPKKDIAHAEHLIQEGDIICMTSFKPDLDIAHQGFAVKKDGHIHLMHASSLAGRVIVAKLPLAQYTAAQRGQTGIIVVRLN